MSKKNKRIEYYILENQWKRRHRGEKHNLTYPIELRTLGQNVGNSWNGALSNKVFNVFSNTPEAEKLLKWWICKVVSK